MSDIRYLYFYLFLIFICWALIFFRAEMRRRLLKKTRQYFEENKILVKEPSTTYLIFKTIFYDTECFKVLKQSIRTMPDSFQKSYRRYKIINYLTYFSIVLVIGFSLTAYRFFN